MATKKTRKAEKTITVGEFEEAAAALARTAKAGREETEAEWRAYSFSEALGEIAAAAPALFGANPEAEGLIAALGVAASEANRFWEAVEAETAPEEGEEEEALAA
ncbi:hypothetical protein [Glycomyces sp. NPDC048151]|uniref:hypothetical protein n=1 Tax=Glycomyces sp. NPDC048151 TaxID=3364002 RepID=UPI0037115C9F